MSPGCDRSLFPGGPTDGRERMHNGRLNTVLILRFVQVSPPVCCAVRERGFQEDIKNSTFVPPVIA